MKALLRSIAMPLFLGLFVSVPAHSRTDRPNSRPPRDHLLNGHAHRRFPTGVVFTREPRDLYDAREVVTTLPRT